MSQYYLEKNIDARERELEREAELEEKSPKTKAKSKMSKVKLLPLNIISIIGTIPDSCNFKMTRLRGKLERSKKCRHFSRQNRSPRD